MRSADDDQTAELPRLLPEMWPLHRVAKELGKATHVLVAASARGKFPPIVQVGAVWFVHAAAVREWVNRNHAVPISQGQRERIRRAGRSSGSAWNPTTARGTKR
ncbi:MAG: hypothetical protein ABIP94_03045 [Planctomycetota bacterium]